MANIEFNKNYNENINKIINIRDLISGTHEMDKDKANLWISSQLNNRRKKAARNLIDNTYYIKFNDIFEKTRNIIIKLYNQKLNKNNRIFILLYTEKNESAYFISIIAFYFIKLLEYIKPIVLDISEFKNFNFEENDQLIILDDVIYSGGQMSNVLKYIKLCFKYNIFVCIPIITQEGLTKIEKIERTNIIYDLLIPKLEDILSYDDFFDLNYYFSPEEPYINISLYLDYKIADEVSTFKNVLLFGIIPPTEINLEKNANYYYNTNPTKKHNNYLSKLLNYEESIQIFRKNIEFIPFIHGCINSRHDLDYNALSKIPYNIFMTPFISEKFKNIPKKIQDILNEVYNKDKRCPETFYKIKNPTFFP